jgi:hypothetical protein
MVLCWLMLIQLRVKEKDISLSLNALHLSSVCSYEKSKHRATGSNNAHTQKYSDLSESSLEEQNSLFELPR